MSPCPEHGPTVSEPPAVSEPGDAIGRSRAGSMLESLPRFGFQRKQLLDDQRRVQMTVYTRSGPTCHDTVIVYSTKAVRAYRRRRDDDTERDTNVAVDPTDVLRWIPLGDAVSVIDAVLSWPSDEPDVCGDGAR